MWVGRRGERYVLKDLARVVHGRHEGNENREKKNRGYVENLDCKREE